jgi:serine/threonine-protein kinase HipA
MAASQLNLFVFGYLDCDWAPCGRLSLTEDGPALQAATFAYGLKYLQRETALEIDPVSLSLQDKTAIRGRILLPPEGLALFGGIRDAAPDAWGRRVIESRLRAPANSLPESTYLSHAGSQRVGAFDIRESLESTPTAGYSPWKNLQYLIEAAERIDAGLPVPAQLEDIFVEGSGLGGARPKATVRDDQQVLWLAKFKSASDTLNVPMIEVATLKLAAAAGLTVPPVRLIHLGDRPVMLIRRFDRYWAQPGTHLPLEQNLLSTAPATDLVEKRMAFVSGLTLLACSEMDSPNKSYADLARAIRRYAHPQVIRDNNRELFARMVFNIFVSNDDDHLRNHGFIWDPRLPGWRLSPLYDVMPRPSVASDRRLHLGVGSEGRAATLDNAISAREQFSVSSEEAGSIIARVWAVVREWKVHFENFAVTPEEVEKTASAFRHLDHVSTPELRRRLP